MIVCACGAETDLVEVSAEHRAETAELAARFDAAGLTHLIAVCDSAGRSVRTASSPRAVLDAALVRMAMSEKLADVAALVGGHVRAVATRVGAPAAIGAGGGGGAAAGKK